MQRRIIQTLVAAALAVGAPVAIAQRPAKPPATDIAYEATIPALQAAMAADAPHRLSSSTRTWRASAPTTTRGQRLRNAIIRLNPNTHAPTPWRSTPSDAPGRYGDRCTAFR